MLNNISDMLKKYAKGWIILVFAALYGLINAVVLPGMQAKLEAGSGGTGPIDLLFFYTPEKVYSMVASYGDAVRADYRTFELTGDIAYPIVYTLLFSLLITWLFQRGFASGSKLQILNVVPFGAFVFDLLENLCIVTMLSIYPTTPGILAWLSTIFTMVKWSFAGVSIVLILVGLVAAVKNGFKKQ